MSGGGGGLDVGKELAQLDKDLSLSEHAPLIASAAANAMGVPLTPVEMGAILGAGRAIDKGSISEGINWGLQGYGGASLAAAAAAPAAAAPGSAGGGGSWVTPNDGGAAEFVPSSTGAAGTAPAPGFVETTSGLNTVPSEVGAGGGAAAGNTGVSGLWDSAKALATEYPKTAIGLGLGAATLMSDRNKGGVPTQAPYDGPLNKLRYDPDRYHPLEVKPPTPYTPVYKDYRNMAFGGLTNFGSDLERFIRENSQPQYATPPLSYDPARYDAEAGTKMVARPGMARGGIADLGGYSDGGRMLKGPGDGMSDSIPATISNKQPARLADGEFVVPADVVSHLGNGSTDAGAKQLYKMMEKVRVARTGQKMQGRQINPRKYVPV